MYQIKQPSKIIIGKNASKDFDFSDDSLVITSSGAKKRGWLDYLGIKNFMIYDNVESNPSINTATKIIDKFSDEKVSDVIGLGGGSCLDVAKFVAMKLKKQKILIPTTFGSGSEVTRISVLKVDNKKQSFHDDELFADISLVDSYFIENTPEDIFKNSVIDSIAQCSEGFDSKNGNHYTKFLCNQAFELLENGVMSMNNEKIVLGSLISGLGFGNCSTTLGHALSYVFSNEGIAHGHALAYTTTIAHKFNDSQFYDRFLKIVKKLNFPHIQLEQNLEKAASIILEDRKHLDNNPKHITKNDIVELLTTINFHSSLN
jgi:malonic semialdehyde reductase